MDPLSPDAYRVIAIDPGSNRTGFSALSYFPGGEIVCYTAFSCHADKALKQYGDLCDVHGDRYVRNLIIAQALRDLIEEFPPNWVISESPFSRHVQTYAALTEAITLFHNAILEYDPYVPFDLIDPVSVKKSIGVRLGGGASKERKDKDLVQQLVSERRDVIGLPHHQMDEHSYDATAIALYHIDHRFKRGRHELARTID